MASIVAAHWGATSHPIFTFFLLPTRCWELLTGGFIAFYFSFGYKQYSQKWLNELGSFIGVVFIVYSIFSFDSKTPFPSFYTLVPTIGTALIIFFATHETSTGKLLGSKFFVEVGLISYSAYLYHQPLFAFAKQRSSGELSKLLIGVLVLATFFLAYFSWKYVEEPFRNKHLINRKKLFTFCILSSITFISIGLFGHFSKGFPNRMSSNELQILSYGEPPYTDTMYKVTYRMGLCFLEPEQDSKTFSEICNAKSSNKSVLIWGDSHAAALSYGLKQMFPNMSQYNASGCPPLKDANISWRPNCKEVNDFVLGKLDEISPSKIFLHANWSLYEEQNPSENLHKTIEYIKKVLPSTEIIVVGPVPHWNPTLPIFLITNNVRLDKEQIFFNSSINKLRLIDKSLRMKALNLNVLYLSPIDALCIGENCLATVDYKNGIVPIASDYGHLTEAGSVALTRMLMKE